MIEKVFPNYAALSFQHSLHFYGRQESIFIVYYTKPYKWNGIFKDPCGC